jgi:hypothetical protein
VWLLGACSVGACGHDSAKPSSSTGGSGGARVPDANGGGAVTTPSSGAGGHASDAGRSGAGGKHGDAAGTGGMGGAGRQAPGGASGSVAGASGNGSTTGTGLSAQYPGDLNIAKDPSVVWTENFEEGTVDALVARYDDHKADGIALDADVPAATSGKASGKLTASGAGPNAVDFFKLLSPGYDELFVRYYAKYEANVAWHHTGVWIGGYNPASRWPNPQAGLKPHGDDRFSVSIEPIEQGAAPRMDFYNYWMKMHSWMDNPMGSTAYYGNALIHEPNLSAKPQWQCIEIHIKVNTSASSGAGAELGVWVDDRSIIQFTDSSPLGYWIKDKFCPSATTASECTDYKPSNPTLVPLDLQVRSTTDLKLNAFWPQNYITDAGSGSVWYDDMVVATRRVGCLR